MLGTCELLHVAGVCSFLRCSLLRVLTCGGGVQIAREKPQEANPLLRVFQTIFRLTSSDPFYAVVAHRNFKRIDN
jgi:hypothetical protein